MSEEVNHGKKLVSWKVPEYTKYKRAFGWYVWMAILSIVVLIYAFFTGNFLLGVIVVIFVTIIIAHNLGEPGMITFSVFEDGIVVGRKKYSWGDFKAFWIIYQPPEVKTLYFDLEGLRPSLSVNLMNKNPVKVREVLIKYLEEDLTHNEELPGDEFSRLLKL